MPGNLGRDRLEDAPHVVGDVLLGVPEVEMAGPALQVDHDDAFGLAPTRAPARLGAAGRHGLQLEHRAQAHAQQARTTDSQDVAPRDAQFRIAQVFPRLSRVR